MKLPSLYSISIFILIAILVSGCNMPSSAGPTPSPELAITEAAQTAQAVPTNTQPIIQPTNVVTQVLSTPTTVSSPTATSTPIPTATATTPPTPPSASCTNLVKFVDDVTIPDDTEMLPGQEFIKTWRIQNVGTCTWTNQYALIYVSGDQMNAKRHR
jgi:Ig-like domain from next to BRCA1 gene